MEDKVSATLLQLQYAKQALKISVMQEAIAAKEGDTRTFAGNTEAMSDITREELTAKLEALESRMDSRVSAIGGKIDAFLAAQAEREKRIDERHEESGKAFSKVSDKMDSMSSDLHAVRRWQSAYTAGVAILTFVAGLAITALIRTFVS